MNFPNLSSFGKIPKNLFMRTENGIKLYKLITVLANRHGMPFQHGLLL